MKHPCGKEFDSSLPVQFRDRSKARIICVDRKTEEEDRRLISLRTLGANEIEYHNCVCGHYWDTHINCGDDLINVPENKKEINQGKIKNLLFNMFATIGVLQNNDLDKSVQMKWYNEIHTSLLGLQAELSNINDNNNLINVPEEQKGISLEQLVNISFPLPANNEGKLQQLKYYADIVKNIMDAINNIVETLEK
jgi:hypothetical protein